MNTDNFIKWDWKHLLENCRLFTRKNPFEERRCSPDEEMTMPKCGVCGAEVKEQPKITEEGTCSVCGAKLAIEK